MARFKAITVEHALNKAALIKAVAALALLEKEARRQKQQALRASAAAYRGRAGVLLAQAAAREAEARAILV